jgi:hypothetical protein
LGSGATVQAQVMQGSNLAATLDLPAASTAQRFLINVPCADGSSATTVRFAQTVAVTTSTLNVADLYYGRTLNVGSVAQATMHGSLTYAGTTNCGWSRTSNKTFGSFSADSDCPTPSVVGNASAPATKIPAITFNNMPAGEYLFMAQGVFYSDTAGFNCSFRFSDGTLSSSPVTVGMGSTLGQSAGGNITGRINFPTAGTRTIEIQATGENGNNQCSVYATQATVDDLTITAYRFPSSSEIVYNPATAFQGGSLKYTGITNCVWATTSGSFANFAADTDCNTPTVAGQVSAPATKIPGMTVNNLPAGRYMVTAQGPMYNSVTASNLSTLFRLHDGTNSSGTIWMRQDNATENATSSTIVGYFEYSAFQSSITFQVQGMVEGGTGDARIKIDGTNYTFEMGITPISQALPMPVLIGGGGIGSREVSAAKTANYTVTSNDNGSIILMDTTSGPLTVTLPSPSVFFKVTIKDATGMAATNPITVARNGSENIDGGAGNDTLNETYQAVSYMSDGTNWFRIAKYEGSSVAGRGVWGGGFVSSTQQNVIDYVSISTLGNATDFGDLSVARGANGSVASSTRGVWGGGLTSGEVNVIDYITILTTGNATDFGDLTVTRRGTSGAASSTRGLFQGGFTGSVYSNVIDYITIASVGNATDFGDLSSGRYEGAGCASPTRGIFAGGSDGTDLNSIWYVTIASLGNATSFGNLVVTGNNRGGVSNSTRGVIAGGNPGGVYTNAIDYITIATTGNATDFGDLSVTRYLAYNQPGNPTRAVFASSYNGSDLNTIDYVSINSTGNATDFGDLTVARRAGPGLSNSHGGL